MLDLFATCPQGLESLLARELSDLGAESAQGVRGGVSLSAELETVYRMALWSRLAHRLLLRLARFSAVSPGDLYQAVAAIDWSEHLTADASLMVETRVRDSQLGQPHFLALKVKDAIVDQFRAREDRRPSVDTRTPGLRLNLFVHRQQAELSLDLSDGGLPTAAAGGGDAETLLQQTAWPQGDRPLVVLGADDPQLVVAAAQRSGQVAPGLARSHPGSADWLEHKPALWQRLRQAASAARHTPETPRVQVWDGHAGAITALRRDCDKAGLRGLVAWGEGSFERHVVPAGSGLLLISPVQQRKPHLPALLERRFAGWEAAAVTEQRGSHPPRQWPFTQDRSLTVRRGQHQFVLAWGRVPAVAASPSTVPAEAAEEPLGADVDTREAPDMLVNRLRKNLRHLGRWARRQQVSCYRLYDADMPEYAAAIDVYQSQDLWAVVQEYAPPAKLDAEAARSRLRGILAATARVLELPSAHIVLKQRKRQKGSDQYEKLAGREQFHEVCENGLKLLVNFTDYLDTGLFLDHRITRLELGRKAQGQHVLNLFAYTGAATVHMVAGGARSSTTVDLSRTYLDWAQRNLGLNRLDDARHRFVQADCLRWLEEAAADPGGKRYGLIFMDPPTFSSSKRMQGVLDIQRDHVTLIRAAVALLRPGGELYFSNNFRRFKLDAEALADMSSIEDISARSIDEDFRRNPRIHQCFIIRRRGEGSHDTQ